MIHIGQRYGMRVDSSPGWWVALGGHVHIWPLREAHLDLHIGWWLITIGRHYAGRSRVEDNVQKRIAYMLRKLAHDLEQPDGLVAESIAFDQDTAAHPRYRSGMVELHTTGRSRLILELRSDERVAEYQAWIGQIAYEDMGLPEGQDGV